MRTHPIYCDWCGELLTEKVIVYSIKHLKPYATYDGARDTWDFCSDAHLSAFKDEAAMRRLARSHRVVGPDAEGAATYRAQLVEGLYADARIAEALSGPRRPNGR